VKKLSKRRGGQLKLAAPDDLKVAVCDGCGVIDMLTRHTDPVHGRQSLCRTCLDYLRG